MVRVKGGWEPLEEFLWKHDPCRGWPGIIHPNFLLEYQLIYIMKDLKSFVNHSSSITRRMQCIVG